MDTATGNRQSSTVVFTAPIELMRTPAEREDPLLSWQRPDRAFFAAGACHILAFRFRELRKDEQWEVVHLRPHEGFTGNHVYATDGEWAFDFNGWTREPFLLEETARRCRTRWRGWDFDRRPFMGSLAEFCAANRQRLPSQYAADPIPRTDAYISQFDPRPPE